ncbi:MAG: hypothetical protein ABW219_07990, partial [Ilumatobacteraceae bacterium]
MVVTDTPWSARRSMTPLQLELSANAPCTSATVTGGFVVAVSDMVISSCDPNVNPNASDVRIEALRRDPAGHRSSRADRWPTDPS